MSRNKIDRTGEENYNNFGTLMKIIEYTDCHNVIIEFQDKYNVKIHTDYRNFEKGNIVNPYDKSVFKVGYVGEGKYSRTKTPKIYDTWFGMMRRCYDPYFLDKNPAYIDCYVCELWHCLQNFGKWYEKNYYEYENEKMHLDKDILIKGNKIYSPVTCVFVPQRINALFIKRKNDRGEYPIGVHYRKDNDNFQSSCQIIKENGKKKIIHLGSFPLNRPFQAFYAYKAFKENYIKEVADEYKNLIPQKLYDAMYRYEVEIND